MSGRLLSLPGRFISEERAPDVHWLSGWVGAQNRSKRRGEENIFDPTGTRTPTPLLFSP
jgi:hypothetical protein